MGVNKIDVKVNLDDEKLYQIEFILFGAYNKLSNLSKQACENIIHSNVFEESSKFKLTTYNFLAKDYEVLLSKGASF